MKGLSSYSIDNYIAERFIRPLAGERRNSLFFGSDRMARVSAVVGIMNIYCP
ncbi:IS66 family transposase [Bacteroides finegoldii]|uniref:IS66 family transposase n=1 Tax=Bacteroides finegoldii TaxID=338188 RepID=UPI0039772A84